MTVPPPPIGTFQSALVPKDERYLAMVSLIRTKLLFQSALVPKDERYLNAAYPMARRRRMRFQSALVPKDERYLVRVVVIGTQVLVSIRSRP